jgi:hypothetical protein
MAVQVALLWWLLAACQAACRAVAGWLWVMRVMNTVFCVLAGNMIALQCDLAPASHPLPLLLPQVVLASVGTGWVQLRPSPSPRVPVACALIADGTAHSTPRYNDA